MNTVQYLNNFVTRETIQNLFIRFSNKYGPSWTSRLGPNGDWKGCEDDWLEALSVFTAKDAERAFTKAFSIYEGFPPDQTQIIKICLKESGVPDASEVITLMVNREFKHPIVKMVFDKIGSWSLSTSKQEDLHRKVKELYPSCLADFQVDKNNAWTSLEAFNAQPKALPVPEKIPSNKERIGIKERLSEYQKKVEEAKLNCKGLPYKEFDKNKVNPVHRDFDKAVYEEFRKYLLSIPEEKTLILPTEYIYLRNRFIGQLEQPELLRKAGYNPTPQGSNEVPLKVYNGAYRAYRDLSGS